MRDLTTFPEDVCKSKGEGWTCKEMWRASRRGYWTDQPHQQSVGASQIQLVFFIGVPVRAVEEKNMYGGMRSYGD
jgi:hypothetical protein